MNRKLAILFFILCVITVAITSLQLFFPSSYEFPTPWYIIIEFIFWLIGISYLTAIVIHVIVNNYNFFKIQLYQKPLIGFRRTISRDAKVVSDVMGFIPVSVLFSFLLLILFILTPILSVLEELPYVRLVNLPLKPNEQLLNNSLTNADMAIMLIISFTGPVFLFLLRQLHYKLTRCENMKRFPGSRILLIFFWLVPFVILGNLFIHYLQTGTWEISSQSLKNLYQSAMDFVVIASIVIVIPMWVLDRKLSKKLNTGRNNM